MIPRKSSKEVAILAVSGQLRRLEICSEGCDPASTPVVAPCTPPSGNGPSPSGNGPPAGNERRRRELGRDAAQAQRLVSVWNSRAARRARPSFYPTIETAMLAGTPWLSYLCPACQTVGEVDLRTLDRHPLTPISGLIPSLSCKWCCPNPPFARLLALRSTAFPPLARSRRR
jgi:hypothetical protein